MNKKAILFLTILLISFSLTFAQKQPIPELKNRVTDLTGTLTQEEISVLEQKLIFFESSDSSNQFVVLMIYTTGEESIEEYSMRVTEEWKIGQAEYDNGLILLIAKNDRKLRIEVGYGLESKITDAFASRVINEYITPKFKTGDFNIGINTGVDEIIKLINGTSTIPTTSPPSNSNYSSNNLKNTVGVSLFTTFLLVILIIAPHFLKFFRKKMPILIILLILLIGLDIVYGIINKNIMVGLGFTIYTILFGLVRSKRRGGGSFRNLGSFSSSSGSSFSSSSFGGFSSGGSSFGGGFSGGGGSFGGGGASGGW